jgi:biotin synthase
MMMRTDWNRVEIAALFELPFTELVFRAAEVHRAHHAAGEVQLCTLLSIKTGGCPEDCGYCSQSAQADSGLKAEKLMDVDAVLAAAAEAKAAGSQRFCMCAAWREPKDRDMAAVCSMVAGVKAMGLETCMTLGMLTGDQARQLKDAGLDYYNHNIDTSPEHYGDIITTRTFQERLDTLEEVRSAGMAVCCGGIVGMGESREDRVGFIHALATLPRHPESVPVNALVPVKGTVLGDMFAGERMIDDIEFVRTVAVARITMPKSMVRLSAGRESMSEAVQALCFLAGANSIFTGDRLLTTANAGDDKDAALLAKLGMRPMVAEEPMRVASAQKPPRNGEGDRAKRGGGVFDTSREVIEAARKDRRSGNPAEVRLWQALRSRPGGFKFRRQHPIGPYRLDFACLSQRLVIEVDGSIHDTADQITHDGHRDREMAERGFRTVRFAARDVFSNLDGVVTAIVAACGEGPLHQPSAGPPPRAGEVLV